KKIKKVLTNSELLVRVNPIYEGSKKEIDKVISDGADIVMLPYFKTKEEVELFVNYVNGRAKVCLLCETSESVKNIDFILTVRGIDYIHIGLNDLHLSYSLNFMFELLTNGTVEMLCEKFAAKGIPYGFGGIAQLGQGAIPAENVIAEHYRLGSCMAILSRSFCDSNRLTDRSKIEGVFRDGVNEIRKYEETLLAKDKSFFDNNLNSIKAKVFGIVNTPSFTNT